MCQFWIQPSATLLSTHQSVILGAKLSTVPLRYLAVLADGLHRVLGPKIGLRCPQRWRQKVSMEAVPEKDRGLLVFLSWGGQGRPLEVR